MAFQSTLPHGSDICDGNHENFARLFQSTLPHGSDRYIDSVQPTISTFQSTLPHGSDNKAIISYKVSMLFQSTLPHGSDTTSLSMGYGRYAISIHAPSRERQFFVLVGFLLMSDFNPRSLTGATLQYGDTTLLPDYISIHAPSRERQAKIISSYTWLEHFNPRSLTGATLGFVTINGAKYNFNPRSLTGATPGGFKRDCTYNIISIHAPSRERQLLAMRFCGHH